MANSSARQPLGEQVDQVAVEVTFLSRSAAAAPSQPAPSGLRLERQHFTVADYRALYDEVGQPWLWWLRRLMPDAALAAHLQDQSVSVHVLYHHDETAGFFELDANHWPDVNLNYFGLRPAFIGHGLGRPFLQMAIDAVFTPGSQVRRMTVNTCTADHERALPNYLAAGFTHIRTIQELWRIPRRLGFVIPDHLRA